MVALGLLVPPDGQVRGQFAQFVGGFHPLAVHFPIALLLLVPILEITGRRVDHAMTSAAAAFVLGLAALSALATPYLGWLLAWSGGYEGKFVTQHLWGGIVVASSSLLSWALRRHGQTRPTTYVGALTLAVLAVMFTGYRGGQLAHGEDHLTRHLPAAWQEWVRSGSDRSSSATATAPTFYTERIAPIFHEHCVVCHGANKRKGKLRLDSYTGLLRGGEHGMVIEPGNSRGSELLRRVNLAPGTKNAMPAEGKPPLNDAERALLSSWIDAGASPEAGVDAIAGVPAWVKRPEAWAPDYRPAGHTIAQLETALNIRLVPRSENPNDGLILRTASNPAACDDAALRKLEPVARYIVDAELARTRITDAGLGSLSGFANLRAIDVSYTNVTSDGVEKLAPLSHLQHLNLTGTAVGAEGLERIREKATLKRVYYFHTPAAVEF